MIAYAIDVAYEGINPFDVFATLEGARVEFDKSYSRPAAMACIVELSIGEDGSAYREVYPDAGEWRGL